MGIYKIQNVLFTKAQQAILAILYGQPERCFYTNEIIRLSAMGTGVIQRELSKFTAAGLITIHKVGNQKQYQANPSNYLYSELRSIVLKTFGLADVIREVLHPISSQITFAFIYGSVAKQEDTVKSDIDLMIVSDNLTYAELYPLLQPAEEKLGRQINPTFYSASEWHRKKIKHNHFIEKIVIQEKIFIIGTEDEFKKLG